VTQKLEDLFKSFTDKTIEEQFAQIEEVRNNRSIERPAVAQRRKKKEKVTSDKKKEKARQLLLSLSNEEKAKLIAKLKGE